MVAILNEGAYDAWLSARPEKAREFMRAYPAKWLTANLVGEKSGSGIGRLPPNMITHRDAPQESVGL